jgi:hypothetical protein
MLALNNNIEFLFIFVEGDTDVKLYGKLLDDNQNIKLIPECCHEHTSDKHLKGSKNVQESTEFFLTKNYSKYKRSIIGIRDADFLRLNGEEPSENVFLTDAHDSEMMMLMCDETFKDLVREYIPSELENFRELRAHFLESLEFLSYLRWLSDNDDIRIKFENLSFSEFCNLENSQTVKCIVIDQNKLVSHLNTRSVEKKRAVSIQDIEMFQQEWAACQPEIDLYDLCNGHDMEKMIAWYLKRVHKLQKADQDIGAALRLSYNKQNFISTRLYQNLVRWQEENQVSLFIHPIENGQNYPK